MLVINLKGGKLSNLNGGLVYTGSMEIEGLTYDAVDIVLADKEELAFPEVHIAADETEFTVLPGDVYITQQDVDFEFFNVEEDSGPDDYEVHDEELDPNIDYTMITMISEVSQLQEFLNTATQTYIWREGDHFTFSFLKDGHIEIHAASTLTDDQVFEAVEEAGIVVYTDAEDDERYAMLRKSRLVLKAIGYEKDQFLDINNKVLY